MDRRSLITALGGSLLAGTGCLGRPSPDSGDTDAAPTTTPLPPGDIDFPDGPKARPQRPSSLTESTAREYVKDHEYRYVYNSLWMGQYTEVTLDCRIDGSSRQEWGFEVIVTCTGYSNMEPPENETGTAGVHADWFTQTYRYR